MNDYGVTTIPRQNFAVASVKVFRSPNTETPPIPTREDINRLAEAQTAAWRRWWELFCAPDVWTDPAVRRAMCAARLEYQDTVFDLAAACAQRAGRELR